MLSMIDLAFRETQVDMMVSTSNDERLYNIYSFKLNSFAL